ncbi:HEPN domain-containing protein [Olivibacter sp. SA151]|uniref:HEPN domain-containing protein n=1 Tax=Olivibacter jilunii TaxID=985016 RepID=UPI003F18772B
MDDIKPVLEKLAEKIPVDRIFKFSYSFFSEKKQHVLVVIDSKCQIPTKALEPMAELCFAEIPFHHFTLIPYGELKTAINNGVLYYSLACREQNLKLGIGQKALPDPTKKELENTCMKAVEHYEKAKRKQSDFLEGMEFYRNKGNFAQALFMLHQATELTFRGIEQAIFKRDRPSHSLQEHLKLMAKYIPDLSQVFDKEESYYYRLLKLIDQSYTAVRYQRQFDVEQEELEQLIDKLIPLLTWCANYYQQNMIVLEDMIQQKGSQPAIEAMASSTSTAITLSFPDQLGKQLNYEQKKTLNTICTNLIKKENLQQLVLIGHETGNSRKITLYQDIPDNQQTDHCFLLGIGANSSTTKSHIIVHPEIRVTVILSAHQRVSQALEKKNRFFIQTLSLGTTLYIHSDKPALLIPEPDWSLALEKARSVWNYKKYKSDTFLVCAHHAIHQRQDTHIAMFLVSQSMEQLCIGLIYACLGYHVDQSTLPFLLQITKLISPQLADCFAFGGSDAKQAFKSLSNSLHAVRYKKEAAPNDRELEIAMACYERFQTIAKACCDTHFAQLERRIQEGTVVNNEPVETANDALP